MKEEITEYRDNIEPLNGTYIICTDSYYVGLMNDKKDSTFTYAYHKASNQSKNVFEVSHKGAIAYNSKAYFDIIKLNDTVKGYFGGVDANIGSSEVYQELVKQTGLLQDIKTINQGGNAPDFETVKKGLLTISKDVYLGGNVIIPTYPEVLGNELMTESLVLELDGTQTTYVNNFQVAGIQVNKKYKIGFKLENVTAGVARAYVGGYDHVQKDQDGVYIENKYVDNSSADGSVYVWGDVNFTGKITIDSVKEVIEYYDYSIQPVRYILDQYSKMLYNLIDIENTLSILPTGYHIPSVSEMVYIMEQYTNFEEFCVELGIRQYFNMHYERHINGVCLMVNDNGVYKFIRPLEYFETKTISLGSNSDLYYMYVRLIKG